MNTKDRIAIILTVGTITIVGSIVIGGIFIAYSQGKESLNTEVLTIIKMSLTGLISVLSYYMGQKSNKDEK